MDTNYPQCFPTTFHPHGMTFSPLPQEPWRQRPWQSPGPSKKNGGILGDFWHEFSHCRKKTGVLRMKIATYPSQVSRLPPLGVDRVGSPRDLEVTRWHTRLKDATIERGTKLDLGQNTRIAGKWIFIPSAQVIEIWNSQNPAWPHDMPHDMTTKRLNPLRLVTDVLVLVGSASSLKGKIHLRESKPSCFHRYKHIWSMVHYGAKIFNNFHSRKTWSGGMCSGSWRKLVFTSRRLRRLWTNRQFQWWRRPHHLKTDAIVTIVHALKICAVHTWISLRLSINLALVNIWNSPRIHPYHPW